MKKTKRLLVMVAVVALALALSACVSKTCDMCGDVIDGDPVEAAGRTYCDYDCYMNDFFS